MRNTATLKVKALSLRYPVKSTLAPLPKYAPKRSRDRVLEYGLVALALLLAVVWLST